MKKTDVLELRRRLKPDSCTISRMSGCYVDAYKNKVLEFNDNFLNLPEEEFHKFLEVAKKTMGGTIGNNILELKFAPEEEEPGGKVQFFSGLRESDLKNEELLERLYDLIIENYDHTGNFLILVYRDNYDIMTRTSDNLKLDESEEVYEYLLVSVCPVELSKAGLGYREEENRIGARVRDWIVCPPEIGFLFPAFDDHSADIHSVDYFLKDPKDSHAEFAEAVLGCGPRRTASEQKKTFSAIVRSAYNTDEAKGEEVLLGIQESMNNRVEMVKADAEINPLTTPIVLSHDVMDEILEENDVKGEPANLIREVVSEEFADEKPEISHLYDQKSLEAGLKEKRERELTKEVAVLKDRLNANGISVDINSDAALEDSAKVFLRVPPEKEALIREEILGDQKYVLIPVEDDEKISVNGKKM